MSKTRMSGIELLKIVAIFIIVFSHVAQTAVTFSNNDLYSTDVFLSSVASNSINQIILFFRNFGSLGNIIFIVCSAFFLCSSNKTRLEQTIKIAFDTWIISYFMLFFVFAISVKMPFEIPTDKLLNALFPLLFTSNWFIDAYVLLVLIHPLLNHLIDNYDSKKLTIICIILFVIYDIVVFILGDSFLFYNRVCEFILYYLIVGILKKNHGQVFTNKKYYLSLFLIGFIGLIVLFFCLGNANSKSEIVVFSNGENNPMIFLLSLGLFGLFYNMKFKSDFVNKISGLSLFIYLLHENFLFRTYVRPWLYVELCNSFVGVSCTLIVVILSLAIFVVSTLVAYVYSKTLSKLSKKASAYACKFAKDFYMSLDNKSK